MNKRRRYKAKRRRKERLKLLLFFDAKILRMEKMKGMIWTVVDTAPQWTIPADRRRYTFVDNQWPK